MSNAEREDTTMPVMDTVRAGGTYAGRLIENDYARENLTDAVENLRAARKRASRKKAAKLADDKRLYEQVRTAAGSLRDATRAIVRDETPPKRSWTKRFLVVGLAGGVVAIVANADLRQRAVALVGGQSEEE
jgi:hypothetical protein